MLVKSYLFLSNEWDYIIKKVSALYPDWHQKIKVFGLKQDYRKTKGISKIELEVNDYSYLWDNLDNWLILLTRKKN